MRFLFDRIRNLITSDSTMRVETDDSWFNGMDMPLLGSINVSAPILVHRDNEKIPVFST
ncbi:MAG: hypothetical protein P8J17_02085 [Halioglobus sp.]|nr:hypothetical protein [Halioglobus sp.]